MHGAPPPRRQAQQLGYNAHALGHMHNLKQNSRGAPTPGPPPPPRHSHTRDVSNSRRALQLKGPHGISRDSIPKALGIYARAQ